MPAALEGNEDAMAYYGVLKPLFEQLKISQRKRDAIAVDTALALQEIIEGQWKVQFWDDDDAKKQAINSIDDYFIDEVRNKNGLNITFEQIDEIISRVMKVAESRSRK